MKDACLRSIVVILLLVAQLVAGRVLHEQNRHTFPLSTSVARYEEWISYTAHDPDVKDSATSFKASTIPTFTTMFVSTSLHGRDTSTNIYTTIPPSITPITILAGIFLIVSGLAFALIGTKNQRTQVFLSTTYLSGLGLAVLVLHLANPPTSLPIQGAYLVAVFIPAVVIGSLALLFKNVLQGIAAATGGFSLAMFIMTLHNGAFLASVTFKATFIGCFTLGAFALTFNRHVRTFALVGSTSLTGASALVLGVDCFSRAGMKEFWVYIWAINSKLFLDNQVPYLSTTGMAVEMAGIVIVTMLGILSQTKIWNLVMRQKNHHDQAIQTEKQQQDDTEFGIPSPTKHTHICEEQETEKGQSDDLTRSEVVVDTLDGTKDSVDIYKRSELDGDVAGAHQSVFSTNSPPKVTRHSNDTLTSTGSIEPLLLNRLDSVRKTSASDTVRNPIKSCDDPFLDSSKAFKTFPARSLGGEHRQVDTAKSRRFSWSIKASIEAAAEKINLRHNVSSFSSFTQHPNLSYLTVHEDQISQPLIGQESIEEFVSSFLGHPPTPSKKETTEVQVVRLTEHSLEQNPVVGTEGMPEINDRPPTRHGPLANSDDDRNLWSQAGSLLRTRSTGAINSSRKTTSRDEFSILENTSPLLESLALCQPIVEHQPLRGKLRYQSKNSVAQIKPITELGSESTQSCSPPRSENYPVPDYHTKRESRRSFSAPVTISQTGKTEARKDLRTYTAVPRNGTNRMTGKILSTSATEMLSDRSNLRSSFGTWPQYGNSKHSLQRRLQTSLQNSRNCVLTFPIDEDEVASFTSQPLISGADLRRRASYPYHSNTANGPRYTTSQPSRAVFKPSLAARASTGNAFPSTRRQHLQHESYETTMDQRRQVSLRKVRSEGNPQTQRQTRQTMCPSEVTPEEPGIPQHTLYRASLLAEWRRSSPIATPSPDRCSSEPSTKQFRNSLPNIKAGTSDNYDTTKGAHNSYANRHSSVSSTRSQSMAESPVYSSDKRIFHNNIHGSVREVKLHPKGTTQLSSREINVHREVLRCMQNGTFPVFEDPHIP